MYKFKAGLRTKKVHVYLGTVIVFHMSCCGVEVGLVVRGPLFPGCNTGAGQEMALC